MEKVWLIASGKGGTGKSSLAVNLGIALASAGRRVLLVDLSIGLRCLDLFLGVEDRVLFDVMDVLDGTCRPCDAILKQPEIPLLSLLPAAQNRSAEELDGKRLRELCGILASEYDLIILDCPPGLEPVLPKAALAAGQGIIVVTSDPVSLRDADRVAAELVANGINGLYLVINRFRADFLQQQLIPKAQEMAESIGLPLLGIIPEDVAASAATMCGKPVVIKKPDSPSAGAYAVIARRIPGKD